MNQSLFNHQQSLDQSLFLAITRNQFDDASSAVFSGANPNSIFLLEKGIHVSCLNLFISQASQIGKSKGPNNAQYISCIRLLKIMIKQAPKPASIECKCLKQHKCPLFIALEAFKITTEEQILESKCDLIRYLIQNGATIKFQPDQDKKALKNPGKWTLKWLDIEGIRTYLITKNFNYVETRIDK